MFYLKRPGKNYYEEQEKSITGAAYYLHKAGLYYLYAKCNIQKNNIIKYNEISNTVAFNVYDQYKPSSPINVQICGDANLHNLITWTANTEQDFSHYEIWRKIQEYSDSYYLIQTTEANSFNDPMYLYAPGAGNFACYYKIIAVDSNANKSEFSGEVYSRAEEMYKINGNKKEIITKNFKLNDNYPNPFNPITNINFQIPKSGSVRLKVYNVQGEVIATLIDENRAAGNYTVTFNGDNLSSGIYFCRLDFDNSFAIKKLILMK